MRREQSQELQGIELMSALVFGGVSDDIILPAVVRKAMREAKHQRNIREP